MFDKFEFNLDRVYVKYSPLWFPELWAEVGKFPMPMVFNPITRGPIGTMLWDEAAHPEGAAAGLTFTDRLGFDTLKYVAGESVTLELSNADEASLFFAQIWGEKKFGPLAAEVSLAYFGWQNLNPDGNTTISTENNNGNIIVDDRFASNFNILNPQVVLTWENPSGCPHPIQFVGETYKNTTSIDPNRDYGYILGSCYGPAVNSTEKGAWKVYYNWTEIQQESVFTPVSQDDLQAATNFRGHIFGLVIYIFEDSDVHLWFLSDEPMDAVNGTEKAQWRFRVDITFRI